MFKKNLSLIIALTLIFTLAGCSTENLAEVTVSVQDIFDKITSEIEFPAMIDMDEEFAKECYPFDRSVSKEFIIYHAMMNIRSDELAIFKVEDKNKMSEIEKAIQNRTEQLDQTWGSYLPDQYEKVKNHVVEKNGEFIMFAITDDQEKVVEIFNSFFK